MMTQQLLAVLGATIAQFIIGAIWYTPLFGKLWGKIHGFDKLDQKTQQKMMSEMGPLFGIQIIVTILTSIIMVVLHTYLSQVPLLMLTFLVWLGFVVPAHVSGILFSNTPRKWMLIKCLVMSGGSLASLVTGALSVAFIFR